MRNKCKTLIIWSIPIIGALISLAMWAAIFYYLATIPERRFVQYNPVNNQDLVANRLAHWAIGKQGVWGRVIKFEKHHDNMEYGYFNKKGEWCSLYRSLPLKEDVQ